MVDVARNTQESYVSATEFWTGVECLNLNSAPKCNKESPSGPLTWEISADSKLPWLDADKMDEVQGLIQARAKLAKEPITAFTVQYTAYCGLIPVPHIIEVIRKHLGVAEIHEPEPRKAEPVATLAFTLNAKGGVVGTPFVSSLPWAVQQILKTQRHGRLEFVGFFGRDNVLESVLAQLERDMEGLFLIKAADQADESDADDSDAGDLKPLSVDAVAALCLRIYEVCGWNPGNAITTLRIQAKVIRGSQADKPESSDFLNSFLVEDLIKVRSEIIQGNYGTALNVFMTGKSLSDRIDIRKPGDTTVERSVAPKMMPLGCWPSEHGLVRGQQFAVNKIMQQLRDSAGIFSVNGPPGTGKTTLLRDVVAAVLVERAIKLSVLSSPLDAFKERISVAGWAGEGPWALDSAFEKSGIVVASANNGAVENITKELPSIKALPDGSTLRYLSPVSDSIATPASEKARSVGATWGLVAAVMGNKTNRNGFFQKLRWGVKNKLEEGQSPQISLWEHLAKIKYSPELKWDVAVRRFKEACTNASSVRANMQSASEAVQNKRAYLRVIPGHEAQLTHLASQLAQASHETDSAKAAAFKASTDYEGAKQKVDALVRWQSASTRLASKSRELSAGGYDNVDDELYDAEHRLTQSHSNKQDASQLLDSVRGRRPGFLSRAFSFGSSAKRWEQDCRDAEEALRDARRLLLTCEATVGETKAKVKARDRTQSEVKSAENELSSATALCSRLGISKPSGSKIDEAVLNELKIRAGSTAEALKTAQDAQINVRSQILVCEKELGAQRAGLAKAIRLLEDMHVTVSMEEKWLGAGLSEEALQLESPWFSDRLFNARQELFCRAMELHESFVVHSWSKLQSNFSMLIAINKGEYSAHNVTGGVQRLWDSFFMVVPVVSTTFSSFSRMFDGWGRETIGWLMIDEAGQATPQAALGAIWRAQRVVAVGDPRQLVPVVSLPRELMEPLMKRCRAEKVYHPTQSSVQVLSDMGNRFGTMLGLDGDAQWVGSPLRVHRRCLDPMFSVSNEISYDNMMVYGAGKDKENLWFGNSCWIDVPATTRNGNSVPEQIEVAVRMAVEFEKQYSIKDDEGKFNLYLITPFKDVRNALAEGLRSRIRTKSVVSDMHGTVHAFQGKEAEVVILVLGGAPGSIAFFAAEKPNLLNVALTRAKKRVYVIGSKADWAGAPFYSTLYNHPGLQKTTNVPKIIPRTPDVAALSSE